MATHSSILAWRIPWTQETARLVHGVTKSQIQLSNFHFTFITENSLYQEMLRKKVLFSLHNPKNTVIKWGKRTLLLVAEVGFILIIIIRAMDTNMSSSFFLLLKL